MCTEWRVTVYIIVLLTGINVENTLYGTNPAVIILLEADSSHPLAFDVEKKNPYKNKTKSDTRQMLFLGHEIVFAYILCRLLFRGYCNFSRRS